MCVYHGIYFHSCGHIRFQVHLFCQSFLSQLHRINDETQRQRHDIPFVLPADCEPQARLVENNIDMAFSGEGTNVVRWVMNLSEVCPGCVLDGVGLV